MRNFTAQDFWVTAAVWLFAALVFYFSTNAVQHDFDYTGRIASALLHGDLGLRDPPPSWLKEMVPRDGRYYSVFPLGAVLSVAPVALLQEAALIHSFPGRVLAALIAGLCVCFFFKLSSHEGQSLGRRILLALFPIFGTWAWCNLGFGGAWQIALGFALLGEVATLYFTLVRSRPFLAGTFFALAVGNRDGSGKPSSKPAAPRHNFSSVARDAQRIPRPELPLLPEFGRGIQPAIPPVESQPVRLPWATDSVNLTQIVRPRSAANGQ